MPEGPPPGRARRLWIEGRLDHARRAVDLLDRKRRILRAEEHRAAVALDRARQDWSQASELAASWAWRTQALASAPALEVTAAAVRDRARVEVGQADTVGVRHPDNPRPDLPSLSPLQAAAAGPLVSRTAEAHVDALGAAARLGVAERTYQALHAELRLTERRHRAIERVRIPALEEELTTLRLRLEELERQDRVVARWVSSRPGSEPR